MTDANESTPNAEAEAVTPKAMNPVEAWVQKLARRWFTPDPVKTGERAQKRLAAHVAAHGGSGTAIIAAMGNRGFRISAVAADGAFGDAIVPTQEIAEQVCEASGLTVGEWDRATIGLIAPSPADRIRMAGTGR